MAAEKRARLLDFRARLPYCSHSALSTLLRVAEDGELPGRASRKEIAGARDTSSTIATPYGALHQEVTMKGTDGDEVKLEVQAPLACFWQACNISASLSALVRRVHDATPSTIQDPWKLVMYCDEVLPGNQLAYRTERKFWAFYWSLLNFGSAALADEARNRCAISTCSHQAEPSQA